MPADKTKPIKPKPTKDTAADKPKPRRRKAKGPTANTTPPVQPLTSLPPLAPDPRTQQHAANTSQPAPRMKPYHRPVQQTAPPGGWFQTNIPLPPPPGQSHWRVPPTPTPSMPMSRLLSSPQQRAGSTPLSSAPPASPSRPATLVHTSIKALQDATAALRETTNQAAQWSVHRGAELTAEATSRTRQLRQLEAQYAALYDVHLRQGAEVRRLGAENAALRNDNARLARGTVMVSGREREQEEFDRLLREHTTMGSGEGVGGNAHVGEASLGGGGSQNLLESAHPGHASHTGSATQFSSTIPNNSFKGHGVAASKFLPNGLSTSLPTEHSSPPTGQDMT